jgi:oxygen-dependent protoporphyrinogen oxidase
MATVSIIGGGISGLAAAYRLQRIAPDVEVTLLEAERRLGGKILTDRSAGFLLEGGPDSFLTSKPRGVGLCEELGIAGRLQATRSETRRSFVLHDGVLHPMPEGLTGLVPSRIEPLLESELFTSRGRERLQQEPYVPPRPPDGDESLGAFTERRFGREVYDRLIEPLMAGIYAADGRQLSLMATFPQLRAMELAHGSLLRGMESAPRVIGGRAAGFVAPLGGMAEIVDTVAQALSRAKMICGAPVRRIRRTSTGFRIDTVDGSSVTARAVIVTTPAHVSSAVLREVTPATADALSGIRYVSTATVSLGFALAAIPELPVAHGYVIPRVEGRPALACTFVSQKLTARAPDGSTLVRVFIGRAGEPDPLDLSDADLLDIARSELRSTLDITAEPSLHRVFRWPHAMPQYALGHLNRLVAIETDLANTPGVFIAGALTGVGIPDCIASGDTAATAAADYLQSTSN